MFPQKNVARKGLSGITLSTDAEEAVIVFISEIPKTWDKMMQASVKHY